MTSIRRSRSGMPTCTCIPKMRSSRMTSCSSSSRTLYRSCSVTCCSCQCEKGCVPADARRSPCGSRWAASVPRRRVISSRASVTLSQIFVPASMTDCIISGFTCSPRVGRAAARSVSLCDFSWPSASMIWNSSSMPIVRRGTSIAPTLVRALEALIRADPSQVATRRALDRGRPTGVHDAVPPAAVDAVEPERADRGEDTADRFRRQRDVVRVASHEAHEAHVGNDRDRVANEERALADAERRLDADPGELQLELADLEAMPLRRELLERRPSLAALPDVLPLVLADGTPGGRPRGRRLLDRARDADVRLHRHAP